MKRCNSMLHLAPAYTHIYDWMKMGECTFFLLIFLLKSSRLKNLSRHGNTSDLHHQHWLKRHSVCAQCTWCKKPLDSLQWSKFLSRYSTLSTIIPKSHMTSGKNTFSRFIQEMIMYLKECCALNAQKFCVSHFFFFFSSGINHTRAIPNAIVYACCTFQ